MLLPTINGMELGAIVGGAVAEITGEKVDKSDKLSDDILEIAEQILSTSEKHNIWQII